MRCRRSIRHCTWCQVKPAEEWLEFFDVDAIEYIRMVQADAIDACEQIMVDHMRKGTGSLETFDAIRKLKPGVP